LPPAIPMPARWTATAMCIPGATTATVSWATASPPTATARCVSWPV